MRVDTDDLTISESVSDLALVALEHGLADRQDRADFTPFLLITSGEDCYIRRCADENPVNEASTYLAHEADSTTTYALAYDGTITVEGTPFSAILVIAGEPGADAYVFTQRYDAAATPLALIGEPAFIGEHAPLLKLNEAL